MRINQFVAQATGYSRRFVDKAIEQGKIKVNGELAQLGQSISDADKITYNDKLVSPDQTKTILLLNKPVGYVCSRDGQGSPTIYTLIPSQFQNLKHVGRLDKDSSGLIILTNNGDLAHKLSHPSFGSNKIYEVELDRPLSKADKLQISSGKIKLDGKPSVMEIKQYPTNERRLTVTLHEGRNRQIRRTFAAIHYEVIKLNRINIGEFSLSQLGQKPYITI